MIDDLEFVYVGDPMCSWCWGFAPVLERMQEVYEVPLRLVVGGLRPGPSAQVLDDRLAATLAHHWEAVEEASGQPFDRTFLERRDGWVYDTELPAVAVVAMRELRPEATVAFHSHLQEAFYAEGRDITDSAEYPGLIDGWEVDADTFATMLAAEEMRRRTYEDFAEARTQGVMGFPTLLVRDGEEWGIVTRGFMPADRLLPALSDWLLGRYAAAGEDALFCTPGVTC